MGRPRKPTHLKLIDGSRDRRSLELQEAEPKPTGELGEPPDCFSASQKATWHDVLSRCPNGLLKTIDRSMFENFVMAVNLSHEANERMKISPMLIKTPSGIVVENPLLRIIRQQAMLIKLFGSELGFSPAARTRIAISEPEPEDPNDIYFR